MKMSFKKVLRELKWYKGRTFLAFLGILIGVTSIGYVLDSYAILTREMDVNYMMTNPASIVLKVPDLDNNAVDLLRKTYPDTDVELRKTLVSRIDRGNGTYGTLYLFITENISGPPVDIFFLENGVLPNQDNQIVLERDSLKNLSNLNTGYNESVMIKLPGEEQKEIFLSGTVHAPGLAPASMEKYSYAYLSLDAAKYLGYRGGFDEIHLVSYPNRFDRDSLKTTAADMKSILLENGYNVTRVDVPEPGKHPHGDQLRSLLFLLQAFAVISLLVACVIIVNLLNFIMSTQTKQIAIMKSAGANTRDISLPYFLYVVLVSSGSIIVSIPLSLLIGSAYSTLAAGILNFNITDYSVPFRYVLMQIIVGILIPIAASFVPIIGSCRMTIKEGLAGKSEKLKTRKTTGSSTRTVLKGLNTKIIIPVNNVFRKKRRTFLAVLALATGGILFMTSQNITASIEKTSENSMSTFAYDFDVRLKGEYPLEDITNAISDIDGISGIETYASDSVTFTKKDGLDSGSFMIRAVQSDSSMMNLSLLEETSGNIPENRIVINNALLDSEPWIVPGMTVSMVVQGTRTEVTVVGVINEIPPMPCVYMNLDQYNKVFPAGSKQNIMLTSSKKTPEEMTEISREIENHLSAADIEVSENWNISLQRNAFVEHLYVIVVFLSVVALLAVLVGGLSIASAIGMNISERKRELGILRAIGANDRQIIAMISAEVFFMGFAGWLFGLILAYPISVWSGNYFGQIFLHSDLDNTLSIVGALIWLGISLLVSVTSGFLPAREASRLPLREMLSYE